MKKMAVLLLVILLLWVPCMTAFAAEAPSDSATVTVNVPSTHRVTFIFHSCRGEENGVGLSTAAVYDRHSVHTYRLIPDEGKLIAQVLYCGEDVTSQLRERTFTAPPLVKDAILEVFCQEAKPGSELSGQPSGETSVQSKASADTGKTDVVPGTDMVPTGDASSVAVILMALAGNLAVVFLLVGRKRNRD